MTATISTYCDLDDVQTLTGYKYEGDSQPNTGDAMGIIEGISAEIDSALKAAGYTLPIPTASERSLKLLRLQAQRGAACQCWHAMFKGASAPTGVTIWCDSYSAFLEGIEENTMRLPDYEPIFGKRDAKLRVY